MTDFAGLLGALVTAHVRFILVGGVAATLHGATRLTLDVDVVYDRAQDNVERIASALAPLKPYLRGAPPGLPFTLDADTLRRGLNFTLTTDIGELDLLGEIVGGGSYEDLSPHALDVTIFSLPCRCLDLETLIRVKRAAGRPKDLEALAELERLFEERRR